MEVLIKLIDTRIEGTFLSIAFSVPLTSSNTLSLPVIDNQDQIKTLSQAIEVVKAHKQPLVDDTLSAVRNPTQDNIGRQQTDLRELLTAISEINKVMQLPPPKVRASLTSLRCYDDTDLARAEQVRSRSRAGGHRVAGRALRRRPPRSGPGCCRGCT